MRVSCPSCQTNYNIDDKRIPPGGAKLKCSKCQTLFPIKPGTPSPAEASAAAVPLPGAAGADATSGAVPLPGSAAPDAIPLPGVAGAAIHEPAAAGAIPLPGMAAPAPTAGAIPLPGAFEPFGDPGAVPLPGGYDSAPSMGAVPLPGSYESDAPSDSVVPLPGGFAPPVASTDDAIPLPGLTAQAPEPSYLGGNGDPFAAYGGEDGRWDEGSTRVSAMPVPTEAYREPDQFDEDDATTTYNVAGLARELFASAPDAVPLPGQFSPPPPPPPSDQDFGFGVPLPGPTAENEIPEAPSFDFDFAEPTPAAPQEQPAYAQDHSGYGDAAPPPPAADPDPFDFADVPTSANARAAPQEDYSLDFADLPAPSGAAPADSPPPPDAFDFGDLPSPSDASSDGASGNGDALDFADLPSPSGPPAHASTANAGFDDAGADPFAAPNVDPSSSFGEVDFGDPAPRDELEADLSAPLPPSSAPQSADGLEMLSFIDDASPAAKKDNTPRTRFHVRRRSGKVFGPFEDGVIVKMLEDGQLLGNEDVSTDEESWSAIGTVPAFGEAIQRLMDAPSAAAAGPGSSGSDTATQGPPSIDRLKTLYEGRMAAVAVVDGGGSSFNVRARLPLIIGLAVVLVVAGAGGSLSFTRYGLFGLKYFMPAAVKAGSPQFTQLQKAREALLADTFKSYTEARDGAAAILRIKEFPEVRAVWCQAIFYLDRRYAAATPAQLQQARDALEDIKLLGEKHPEVMKALAGNALSQNRPDEARLVLEDAIIRAPADVELKLLLAEAMVARKQSDRAQQLLEGVLAQKATLARALHMYGDLHREKAQTLRNTGTREEANKAADRAAELYSNALKAAPEHVISAVELAAIQILVHREPDKGMEALAKALEEQSKSLMGPAEVARARALHGTALMMKFQPNEAAADLEEALKLDPNSTFAKAQLGHVYLGQREYAKAVPLLKEASQKEPTNLDYVDGYLTVLLGAGKMEDALTVLQSANTQFPENPRIAYLDARVNDALENTTVAEANYLRAIKGDPALVEASTHLGRLYVRERRFDDARKQLEAAVASAANNAAVHAAMGELLLEEARYDDARRSFEKAIGIDPNLADSHLGLSRVELAAGKTAAAEAAVTRALELDPRIPGGHLQRGLVLWRDGKLDDAVVALEAARQNEPKDARVLIKLAAVKLDKKDLSGAEAAVMSALALQPRNHEANYYRAQVKSRRAEHTQAIESMKAALDAAPKNAAYRYAMGVILREAKKPLDAMDEWRTAVEIDPRYVDAMEALGQGYLERGEFSKAIAQFRAALDVTPGRAQLHGLIGDAHFQATEWDAAITSYRAALTADTSLTWVYYRIGRSLSEMGKSAEAVEWYRKATVSDPDNAMPWYYLGFVYKERNQRADAIASFKAYLARRQNAPDKREIEDEIYDLQQGN